MATRFLIGSLVVSGLFLGCACSKTVTIESLLQEMSDRKQLTYLPEPKFTLRQASSYNRETIAPGNRAWFANADMSYFVRVENKKNRREFVLFDQEGPGAVVRWWMTFWRAEKGIIRVYLDNDSIPEIEGPPFDVISGQLLAPAPFSQSVPEAAPLNERGHNLYLPIPFSDHIKITYECDSLREQDKHYYPDVFYNICYREYEKGTKVKTFSLRGLQEAKPELDRARELLLSDLSGGRIEKSFDQTVLPGDSLVLIINDPGSAISFLSLKIDSRNPEQALRSTVLSVEFDGEQTVWVPVGEFFGTGYIMFPHKTWVNQTSTEGAMKASWIMPYREQCRLSYINFGKDTIRLTGETGLSEYTWKTGSMYFGTSWHEYHHIKTRNEQNWFFDINFVNIKGKGCYIGDQVTLFNMAETWWGEGDEKIFVDGEKFPSSIGTGSEDYYGYAFGHPEPFSHPFISEPTGAGNFVPGMTVNMRHRSLDAIPFGSSISSNIELWHWASTCINYAMTACFYVQFPFEINIKPDIEGVQRRVATAKENFYEEDSLCFSIETYARKGTVKVAIAQIFCLDGDRSGNIVRIENAIIEAIEKGAEIVAFPESSILGWVNPDAHTRAFSIPGPDSEHLCALAKKYKVFISIGLDEKEGDKLFDSAILIDDEGSILLKHRKINTLDELMSPPYTKGEKIEAINTRLGRIGVMICADSFQEDLLIRMKAQRPDWVIIPYGWAANETDWPVHGKELLRVVQHVAGALNCPVIGTDLVGEISHGPWRGMVYGGQSVAVDRHAKVLATGQDRDKDIVVFEVTY